jgi:hypothetical protein
MSKPCFTRKKLSKEKIPGKTESVATIEMKTSVAIAVVNFPYVTMVSMIHLKSITKKTKPKEKPQIAALDITFSLSMATKSGINADHAKKSRPHGGNARDSNTAPKIDKNSDPIMLGIQMAPSH